MKKELHNINISLNRSDSNVNEATCSCPAGLSVYCNHVMAVLFELAEYSLNQLDRVPEEISCTSKIRQWGGGGVPGEKRSAKEPIMNCDIVKTYGKKRHSKYFI